MTLLGLSDVIHDLVPRSEERSQTDKLGPTVLDSAFTSRHEGILGFEISYVYYMNCLVDVMRFLEGVGSHKALGSVLRALVEGQVCIVLYDHEIYSGLSIVLHIILQRSWMIDPTWKFRYISQHQRFSEILEVLYRYCLLPDQNRLFQDDVRLLLRSMETFQIGKFKSMDTRQEETSLLVASGRIEDAYNVLVSTGVRSSARDTHHELLGILRTYQLYNILSRYEEAGDTSMSFRRAGRYAKQISQEAKSHFQHARDVAPQEISHYMRLIELYTIEGDVSSADDTCSMMCSMQDHFDVHAQHLILLLHQITESPDLATIEQAVECCLKMIDIDPTSEETAELAIQLVLSIHSDEMMSPVLLNAVRMSIEQMTSSPRVQEYLLQIQL